MNLDKVKQNTTWNDASGSINSNFEKIRQAILSILQGGGGSANMDVDTAMSDTSENAVQNKVIKKYVDQLRADLDAIVNGDASAAIESINEILAFLSTIEDTTTLEGIIAGLKASMEKYTDEEVAHIEGVLNARIDSLEGSNVYNVYYTENNELSEEQLEANKKAYAALMSEEKAAFYLVQEGNVYSRLIVSTTMKSASIEAIAVEAHVILTAGNKTILGTTAINLYSDGHISMTVVQNNLPTEDEVNTALEQKQDVLVSGTTIKTINGQDILGEGDIVIEGGGSDIEVDSSLDMYSENPIQNQAVAKMFNSLSEYLQERHESYNQNFTNLSGQLPWISIVDFETAIEQEEPIGDDVRNALLEIGGYNPDKPYSTQGWVWSQGYLYTIKVIPTDAGVQIQLFSFKGWCEILEDNSKVNHLPSQGGGSIEVDAELSDTSENAVSNKAVTMALAETEEVAAAALNELNKRFDDYATKEDIDATLAEMDEEINHIEGVLEATIIEDEEVTAAALNDLDKRVTNLEQNGGGGGGGDIYNVSFTIDPSTMELVMAYDVQPTFDFTLDENGNLIAII